MSTWYHCLTCEEQYTQSEYDEGIKWCSMCCQKDPKIISEYELEARKEDPETYAEIDRYEEEREAKRKAKRQPSKASKVSPSKASSKAPVKHKGYSISKLDNFGILQSSQNWRNHLVF